MRFGIPIFTLVPCTKQSGQTPERTVSSSRYRTRTPSQDGILTTLRRPFSTHRGRSANKKSAGMGSDAPLTLEVW